MYFYKTFYNYNFNLACLKQYSEGWNPIKNKHVE